MAAEVDKDQPATSSVRRGPRLVAARPEARAGVSTARILLRGLWRRRALLAACGAFALAVAGESLSRSVQGAAASDPQLGARLLQVAALLVGLVAWVNGGLRLGPAHDTIAVSGGDPPVPDSGSFEPSALGPAHSRRMAFAARLGRFRQIRERLGWAGTLIGLGMVCALALQLYLLLRDNFSSPFAPWLWLAMLLALAATFVAVRPWPAGASLVTHDPDEPAEEPPVSRTEWLAVGAILLVAAVLRTWNLENVPTGPYVDEGDRAIDARHLNRGEPVSGEPFIFFGTGWWGVPSLYFWLVAQSLKAFGDTLAGARMVHAIAGIGTVWYTYRVGRLAWSPRVGLIAAGLIALSDFAIHFSRTAGESTITQLTWIACFYYLYKALKTRRPLDFVLSGIAGGLTLYGYASGKLLPAVLLLAALYLLARWRLQGVKRYLPGLTLLALAALLTYAPNGLYIVTQRPDAFTQRYNGVSIFTPANRDALFAEYGSNNWGVVLARQAEVTFAAFDVGKERGPFFVTDQPVLPVPWAALWVLGVAYIAWRALDVRFGLLGIWLLGGLAGAALTNDTPTLQRVAAMVPLLALAPAFYLDRVASDVPRVRWPARARLPLPLRSPRRVLNGAIAILVVALGAQTALYYFGPYAATGYFGWPTLPGRYAQQLNPARDTVYQMDVPNSPWYVGTTVFLADRVQGRDLENYSVDLPLLLDEGKNAHFLVYGSNEAYLPVLQTYYPGGSITPEFESDGRLLFQAYTVSAGRISEQRQVRARYGTPGRGVLYEQSEPRLGTLGGTGAEDVALPSELDYPLQAEWVGGLVAPAYGTYRFSLHAPAGANLQIDGRSVLTATALPASAPPAEATLVLAEGVHDVRLVGAMGGGEGMVDLRWGSAEGQLVPIEQRFLWGGPRRVLLGESYQGVNDPGWLTAPQLPQGTLQPVLSERVGLIGWRALDSVYAGSSKLSSVWRGGLEAPATGTYLLDLESPGGPATLWIDGKLVGARGVSGAAPSFPAGLHLDAGEHKLEVRYVAQRDAAQLELYWQPPGGQREIIPPTALGPAEGGVWTAQERPGVPGVDPAALEQDPSMQH